jgi:hypothetical protein
MNGLHVRKGGQMGAVSTSVNNNLALQQAVNNIKLAAASITEYQGLEHAFRLAVENAINNNPAVRNAIAAEVQNRIINVFNAAAAAAAGRVWPFPPP